MFMPAPPNTSKDPKRGTVSYKPGATPVVCQVHMTPPPRTLEVQGLDQSKHPVVYNAPYCLPNNKNSIYFYQEPNPQGI